MIGDDQYGLAVGTRPTRRARAPPRRRHAQMPALIAFMNRLTMRKRWRGKRYDPGITSEPQQRAHQQEVAGRRAGPRAGSGRRAARSASAAAILAGELGRGAALEQRAVERSSGLVREVDERASSGSAPPPGASP